MSDIIIGRQQILDHELKIYAYELLFRGADFDIADPENGTRATNQIITDTLLEVGLNNIVGSHKAFINFTTQNILEKTPLHLPKDRIVIEILEDIKIDKKVIDNVRDFSNKGYIIALDDFIFTKEWQPLVEIADIVKIDVMAMSMPDIKALIAKLKPFNVKCLAEKVETHTAFLQLEELGCDFFQGYFFSKPNLVEGKRIGVNQLAAIKLLTTISKAKVDFNEITAIIAQDVGLSYKLLHYINASFFGLPRQIQSIQHAISCLGLKEVRRWTSIVTLASLSDKPTVILENALICARMCEQIALLLHENAEQFFMIGMLAHIDGLLDIALAEALKQLPLEEAIVNALLYKQGIAGETLKCVIDFEQWQISGEPFKNISKQQIGAIYLEAISWTEGVLNNIN
ncbi:MAG: HDOD domain-containing protein [Methylococcaceae bacterium]|nr:HDOD domain-containing protein [Methylococcaceae bacterium]